jgi:pimeloyl-ACP methyl ester carboxylesterase
VGLNFQREGIDLEYIVIGTGPRPMLAFHGFGKDAEMFKVLASSVGKYYTIYSFNLPFQGNSVVSENLVKNGIKPELLKKFIKEFLETVSADKVSLMGYSIGGKIVLKLIEIMPESIDDVFLFAPDGIKLSAWYKLVTHTRIGNTLFLRMMKFPERYLKILSGLEKIRIVHPRTANFVRGSLDTDEKRKLVFKTWLCLRKLDPAIKIVQELIGRYKINSHLFFGKFDKVIPSSLGIRFGEKCSSASVHILESGHELVKEKTNAILNQILSR